MDSSRQMMTHVSADRLPLIFDWNESSIRLTPDFQTVLDAIGPTEPDVYGNGRERRSTPCKVVTTNGEVINPAMVCVQSGAPVQHYLHFRLGKEVASIAESEFALPREVRLASSRAHEMRMGFSPSLIEMPDGKRFVLNGMTSFLIEPGYSAADARVAEGNYFSEVPPPDFPTRQDVTYFVFDGDPGWGQLPEQEEQTPPKRRPLFKRLFGL